MINLSTVSTRELCDELAKRDGVKEYAFPPSCDRIEVRTFQYDGKGRILVINGRILVINGWCEHESNYSHSK